ncbi:MAG: hypothetical protein ACOC5R_03890 [Elusimicrobiota bacterium]
MKKLVISLIILLSFYVLGFSQASNNLDSIIIYKGEKAGTGTGVDIVKLGVGETITVTAKGVDVNGNEVCMAPTWKSDEEIDLYFVEGKGKTIRAKLVEPPALMCFFEVVVIKENGEKVTAQVTVQEKK